MGDLDLGMKKSFYFMRKLIKIWLKFAAQAPDDRTYSNQNRYSPS